MDGTPANISIRMDAEMKVQAGALFAELGMNRSTAFHIFVRQLGLPPGVPYPPDGWLLIYRIEDDVLVLTLACTEMRGGGQKCAGADRLAAS